MLSFHCTPRVVNFEALVAVARTTVHATLGGLLGWWLTEVTHDGCGRPRGLPVPLDDSFQSEVAEQTIDSSFSQIHIVLTAGARKSGCPRGQGTALPAWSANSVNFVHARGREPKSRTALIGVVRSHVIE